MEIDCPKCGIDCEMDEPNHVGWLEGECEECKLYFCYDEFRNIYYNDKGVEYEKV